MSLLSLRVRESQEHSGAKTNFSGDVLVVSLEQEIIICKLIYFHRNFIQPKKTFNKKERNEGRKKILYLKIQQKNKNKKESTTTKNNQQQPTNLGKLGLL